MQIPPSTIYITLLILLGLLRQIPNQNLKYTLKHWFLRPEIDTIELSALLKKTSFFYTALTPHDKKIFEKRVLKFMILKRFIPMKEVKKITPEMKALIASKAIQVTFGYPNIYLTYLKKIYVYPGVYKSKTHRFYQGETSDEGYIKLSWNNFIAGEINPRDGISLGIHEFSHALHIENHIQNDYYLFIKPIYLVALRNAYIELKDEIIQYNTPIREYGVTNFHEFFAVLVEVYFEKPYELRKYNALLYDLMCKILNQDLIKYYEKPKESLHL